MKDFLNTLMIGDWVECDGVPTRVSAGMLKALYYDEECSKIDIKPILMTRDLIEHNGWRFVFDFGDEDLYGKRVREGENNDEYIVSMYVSQNNEVYKMDVCKIVNIKGYGEYRDFVCMSRPKRVYVHTFQNLLNLLGLKETSEEFNIM